MICKKCGKQLPNEGFICKFCGAMMDQKQIMQQKDYLKERRFEPKLKTELYGMEKINYRDAKEQKDNKLLGFLIVGGIIIFLIILAILINIK